MPTLSLCVLNDLNKSFIIHVFIPEVNEDILRTTLRDVVLNNHEEFFCLYWNYSHKMENVDREEYIEEFFQEFSLHSIIADLLDDGYCVYNRVEKYYVLAIAIDFVRFEVFSKDCDKELLDWHTGYDERIAEVKTKEEIDALNSCVRDGEIRGIVHNSNYNENPVITMMKRLNLNN